MKVMRTIYGPDLVPMPSSNVEMAINVTEAEKSHFYSGYSQKEQEKEQNLFPSFYVFS